MEVTKKVGDPDPLGPQGRPSSVSSQQLGGGLQGSRGPWTNSGSMYLRQGFSLSTEVITEGVCGQASEACVPEPICQLLQGLAEVSAQGGCEQASQEALGFSSASPFPSPVTHLLMENGTLALPLSTGTDSTSDTVQHGFGCSWLQEQGAGRGKAPAKVLVGWGKGPCSTGQLAPLDIRMSPWLPCTLPGEDSSATAQGPLLTAAQDQGQGKGLCPAQAPPTPAQANTPAPESTAIPATAEPYTCHPDRLTGSIATTRGLSQDPLLRKCGHQLSVLLESSSAVTSCQDKGNLGPQEKLPTAGPTQKESPGLAQELQAAGRQTLPRQPEKPAEKPPAGTSRPGSPAPGSGSPDTEFPRSQETCGSQADQRPLKICSNTCSSVSLSACRVACHKQSPVQPPKEAMQAPLSTAPTCQLQGAMEDQVLVFDAATGNTRMGELCYDLMGSQAVLMGFMPKPPAVYGPETMPSPWPWAVPMAPPDSKHPSFWPISSVLSSPVPSSLSSGSYREVALVPKEARLNLGSLGTETPLRLGVLSGPVPLAFGEGTLSRVHDPGCSKPDAEKTESSHTLWRLDASGMQDTLTVQAKKLQWMNSEPTPEAAPSATPQEAPRSLLPEEMGCHSWKEVHAAHPDNPPAEGAGQDPSGGWPPLADQHPLSGQPPPTGQPASAEQPASTRQPPLPGQPPLTGPVLARQLSFTGPTPFSQDLSISKELILPGGTPTTREAGHAPALCREGEALGLPSHVGVLQMPPAPEKTCDYVSREKAGVGAAPGSSAQQRASWPQGSSHSAQEEQLSLTTSTAPGPGCRVLPMATGGPEPQGPQLKLTAEDIAGSSMDTKLGLLRGAYCDLVSSTDSLPVQSPVLCCHSLGPYQVMAAVVIDTGTGFTKCGLAREDHILSVVPSCVQLLQPPGQHQPRSVIPENREGSSCTVLNRGVVSDWDALEVLWQHLFYCRLGVQPEELAVLVADSPTSPRTNREKVAEILFEHFHVPAMQTAHQALLALYAYGRTTGLVLGSGHGTSYVAPILTGDLAPLDTYRLDVAGADLTEYLAQLLLAGGHPLPEKGLVNQIKEDCCYVTLNLKAETARAQARAQVDFVLPDKQVITLGSERFCCPEALFQPDLLGLNQPGLPQLALLSISRLEAKQQRQLLANVVLDGGSTLLGGFPERLRRELGPGATVLASPHRAVAAWLGGSIMASRDSFQNLWLSRREYEEEGPWAIYKYHL
ncbi:protein piccolo-like [Pteronotus mesoamericanus]|uniref:protein piccolo-like n=1 Tax=Pteronotus mesoamericanus TaxID=1884717 RepID=UPI0023ED9504|nr:protein piccolo-like [Pteronotus parnellii mesoamericanus]